MLQVICKRCPLWKTCKTNCVDGDGELHPDVLFVGEAPGEHEDREGIPFIGKAGRLLRDYVNAANDLNWKVRFTNAVRCRPEGNAKPNIRNIRACAIHLTAEIVRTNPKIIVPLGAIATQALLGISSIKKVRARRISHNGSFYFPLLHPAYILRNPEEKEAYQDDFLKLFSKDLLKPASADIQLVSLEEIFEYLLDKSEFSFDIETNGLDPYKKGAEIICIGFSAEPGKALVCDLRKHYAKNVLQAIFDLPAESIAHNGKFDINFIRKLTGVRVNNFIWDTRLMSYALNENRRHGLKDLVVDFLPSYAGYEFGLEENFKSEHLHGMAEVNDNDLWKYNGTDAIVTFLLKQRFLDDLKEDGSFDYYQNVLFPANRHFIQVEYDGCKISLKEAQLIADKLAPSIRAIEEQLYKQPSVRKYLQQHDSINFNSTKQKSDLLFKFERLPIRKRTKTGQPEVSSRLLRSLENDLADLLVQRSGLIKLQTTYSGEAVVAWLHDDGYVHTNFGFINTDDQGIKTARTSSSDPNLQTMPRKSKAKDYNIKNLFVSRWQEGKILSADYSQIELRIFAILSNSERFTEVFQAGGDPHRMVAADLFSCSPEKVTDAQRDEAKRVNFGILYGETAVGLTETQEETHHSQAYWEDFLKRYYKAYPEVRQYRKQIQEELVNFGYVESQFGSRRRFPEYARANRYDRQSIERQAANHPIQNAASMLTVLSGTEIESKLLVADLRSKIILYVHDNIVFDVYPGEEEQVITIVKDVMTHPPYSWITLPIEVEISIGPTWGKTEKVGVK